MYFLLKYYAAKLLCYIHYIVMNTKPRNTFIHVLEWIKVVVQDILLKWMMNLTLPFNFFIL